MGTLKFIKSTFKKMISPGKKLLTPEYKPLAYVYKSNNPMGFIRKEQINSGIFIKALRTFILENFTVVPL